MYFTFYHDLMPYMFPRGLICQTLVFSRPIIQSQVKGRLLFECCAKVESGFELLRNFRTDLHFRVHLSTLSDSMNAEKYFEGTKDRFQGITVDSTQETCNESAFPNTLKGSLEKWRADGVRGVWFKVALADSAWVPLLAKNGFRFHHAQASYVMMVCWLPTNEVCNIPEYARTLVGVGAIVINENRQVLVVREKYGMFNNWKLPGGYVEPGEEIVRAAEREVLEETSVRAKFKQMICFRHVHNFTFGCSDMYFIVALTPEPDQDVLKKCDREIDAVEWMNIDDYLNHPHVHSTNQFFLRKFLECEASGISWTYNENTHPILKKPYLVYSVDFGHHEPDEKNSDKSPQNNKL